VPLSPQKRGIGMVFQSYALFPNMTVEQNVAFGLRMQKVERRRQHNGSMMCCRWSS
jgi:putative spermidine/putrescine transport system ATP-binding protein